jgi:hypothetical protein
VTRGQYTSIIGRGGGRPAPGGYGHARGGYGYAAPRPHVGAIIHTPGETETELNTLHGEIMQFGSEADVWSNSHGMSDPEYQRLDAAVHSTWNALHAIEQRPHHDPKNPFLSDPSYMPAWQAAHDKYEAAASARAAYVQQHPQQAAWYTTTWKPFFDDWSRFYHEKKDINWQMLPGSGTWDHIQDYRGKLIAIRNAAPFTPAGPAPLNPETRRDQDVFGGLGDALKGAGSFVKYAAFAGLGLVAVVALGSVVQNVRSGKDPASNYMRLVGKTPTRRAPRRRKATAPRVSAPTSQPAQLALPPGPLEDLG